MNIVYDIHKGGNTKYATIGKDDRHRIINRMQRYFYKFIEDSATDNLKHEILYTPSSEFRTNKDGVENCLASFLGGILAQHHTAERDFSVWQLKGIELASEIFDNFYQSGVITFSKGKPHMPEVKTIYFDIIE